MILFNADEIILLIKINKYFLMKNSNEEEREPLLKKYKYKKN